jgi:hypothetical protein
MPKRRNTNSGRADEGPQVIRTTTLDSLNEKLDSLSQNLLLQKREVADAKAVASSVAASNSSLKKEIEAARYDAAEACSSNAALKSQLESQKSRNERPVAFTSKGNEDQYFTIYDILDAVRLAKRAFKDGRPTELESALEDAEKRLVERLKCIKIADEHPGGWAFVREYLGSKHADNEADDAKLKKAEISFDNKAKKRADSIRGKGRGRGGQRGRDYNSVYVQAQNNQPVYQLATDSQTVTLQPQTSGKNAAASGVVRLKAVTQAGGKLACYHCQGPHLVKYCPQLANLTADVQKQIENSYYAK